MTDGNYELLSAGLIATGRREAERSIRRAMEIQPSINRHDIIAGIMLQDKRPQEAMVEGALVTDDDIRAYLLPSVYFALGRHEEANAALSMYERKHGDQNAAGIAWLYAFRGEKDRAFQWFDHAYTQHDGDFRFIKGAFEHLANSRQDPRYTALLRKLNLPE